MGVRHCAGKGVFRKRTQQVRVFRSWDGTLTTAMLQRTMLAPPVTRRSPAPSFSTITRQQHGSEPLGGGWPTRRLLLPSTNKKVFRWRRMRTPLRSNLVTSASSSVFLKRVASETILLRFVRALIIFLQLDEPRQLAKQLVESAGFSEKTGRAERHEAIWQIVARSAA